jgi:outer membrane lipoprotein-sorting protein
MRKILCGSIALLFVATCKINNAPVNSANSPTETIISATPAFQTKEPDRYRATRTITITNAAGETRVTRTSIVKDGELRRYEAADDADKRVIYLYLHEGNFVLWPREKIYADLASDSGDSAIEEDETFPEALLHSDTISTSYQKIGPESIGGRNTMKYRVVVNSSSSGNVSVSETWIWIDDVLHMPIRSETTSRDGGKVVTELADITLEVDKSVFQIPPDYKRIK